MEQTKLSVRTHLQDGGAPGELCALNDTNCEARSAKTGTIRRDIWGCNDWGFDAGFRCMNAIRKRGYPDPYRNPDAPIRCYKC